MTEVELVKHPIVWVSDDAQLAALCEKWAEQNLLALDTEFMRSTTYYPIPALVQVSDGKANYLIDPLELENISPFTSLLINPNIVKALHSCSEDLEVFHRLFGVMPDNVFDTQLAAALLGYGFSLGYGKLVDLLEGVTLPKGETRSDWLQRPLTEAQKGYAALDVEFLYGISNKLYCELEEKGRLDWMLQESSQIIQNFAASAKAENAYARAKGAWRLPILGQTILRELFTWRETMARERNLPRSRILPDASLFELADKKPVHISQLRKINGLAERRIKNEGQSILDVIERAKALPDSEWPQEAMRPLNPTQKKILKGLRARIEVLAEEQSIAPEILVRKKEYESVARQCEDEGDAKSYLVHVLNGWRRQIICDHL